MSYVVTVWAEYETPEAAEAAAAAIQKGFKDAVPVIQEHQPYTPEDESASEPTVAEEPAVVEEAPADG